MLVELGSGLSSQAQECADFHSQLPNLFLHNSHQWQVTDADCSITSARITFSALLKSSSDSRLIPEQIDMFADPAGFLDFLASKNARGDLWRGKTEEGGTGMTLSEFEVFTVDVLSAIALRSRYQVSAHHVDAYPNREAFADRLEKHLASPDHLVIANFDQGTLYKGRRNGHFSPIANYQAGSPAKAASAVVLETDKTSRIQRHTLPELVESMDTIDKDSGRSRGFLVLEPRSSVTPK